MKEGRRTGTESFHDAFGRLDLVQGNGLTFGGCCDKGERKRVRDEGWVRGDGGGVGRGVGRLVCVQSNMNLEYKSTGLSFVVIGRKEEGRD